MNQVKEYNLIQISDHLKFVEEVNKALNNGWHLYGPTFTKPLNNSMVRFC